MKRSKILFLLVLLLSVISCESAFLLNRRAPVEIHCQGVNKWTKKLSLYPYKMAQRIVEFKIKGVFESNDMGKPRRSRGSQLNGRVKRIASDFMRLRTKNIVGITRNTSKGIVHNFKLVDKEQGVIEVYVAPGDDYGYYEWGKSKYALICDLDQFQDKSYFTTFAHPW